MILLMQEPKRFSVDIDIIISPKMRKEELEKFLLEIEEKSAFNRMELDERRSYKGAIPKAHYKFIYNSNFATRTVAEEVVFKPKREILLDILFAENHYPQLVEIPLETDWLLQDDKRIVVRTPDINSILGDKLTAFAPNTTGIPYNAQKEKEILKQLFDIGNLFDLLTDVDIFKQSFLATAKDEITYRPEREIKSVQQVLHDIIETSLLLARKDILKSEDEKAKFAEMNVGINQFRHFVFVGKFEILEAQVASAKSAYLAALILSDSSEIKKFNDTIPLADYMITNTEYNFLNKRLKFVAKGEALFYWYQTIKLLTNQTEKRKNEP